RALQLSDRVEKRALAGARRVQPVPSGREARERGLLDRFHLASQTRERSLAKRAQHPGIDPFESASAGTELALDDRSRVGEVAQRIEHEARRQAEATR